MANLSLRPLLQRYGITAAFWLIAAAISVSGIQNLKLATILFLVGLAALVYQWREHFSLDSVLVLIDSTSLSVRSRGVAEWFHPLDAIERFSERSLFDRYLACQRSVHDKKAEIARIHAEIGSLPRISPGPGPSMMTMDTSDRAALVQKVGVATNEQNGLIRDSELAWSRVEEDFQTKLARGELVAKGILMRDGMAQRERYIPSYQWRILVFDRSEASAQAHGIHYVGVTIARAPTK